MNMAPPRFAVSEISTSPRTFDEDLAAYVEGGAEGIGIVEAKLPNGRDSESIAKLQESGLRATICIPLTNSILPVPAFGGSQAPRERVDDLCASIRRLAAFDPLVILCLTGPLGGRDAADARKIVVQGLREVARVGQEVGVPVAVEPIHVSARDEFTLVTNLPEAIELLDDVAMPMSIVFDTWHLWDTPDVLEHIRAFSNRFAAVHVNDRRPWTRGWDDRALPGEGIIDLPAILGALDASGFEGWYELEIFSSETYPDSLWRLDAIDLVRRGKDGFLRAWDARRRP